VFVQPVAQLSFNTACGLGFRGSLDEWERNLVLPLLGIGLIDFPWVKKDRPMAKFQKR
jgi:hypothetical protein